jgi:hypothetical protein
VYALGNGAVWNKKNTTSSEHAPVLR